MSRAVSLIALAASISLGASAARAQNLGANDLRAAVFAHPQTAAPGQALPLAGAPPQRPEGVAKTSVEHAFGGKDRVTGAVGFLCGLDERPDSSGAMGAFGSDPQGRFVGAKLSLSFR